MVLIQIFIATFAIVAFVYVGLVFELWAIGFLLVLVASGYCLMAGYLVSTLWPAKVTSPLTTSVTLNLVLCAISLTALFALWFDRTEIRGIDYFDLGIAAARAELNRTNQSGGLVSIFGNLFSVLIYFPLVNMIFDWERWGKGRMLVGVSVVLCIAGLTYLTAGRTVILIALALVASAMLGRGALGQPRLPNFLTPSRLLFGIVGITFVFGMIFSLRANTFGAQNAADYLNQMCIHLSQPAIEIMMQCPSIVIEAGAESTATFLNYANAIVIYAFHVAWIGESILADRNYGQATSFAGLAQMGLSRFGYQIVATDYDGYFIAAAPGLIFDFGYGAMILAFIILGIAFGFSQRLMEVGYLVVGRIAFTNLGATIILSVLISSANLPFHMLSLLSITIVILAKNLFSALVKSRNAIQVRQISVK